MSNKEKIVQLLDTVPDYKMGYILAYVQGITIDSLDVAMAPQDEKYTEVNNMSC